MRRTTVRRFGIAALLLGMPLALSCPVDAAPDTAASVSSEGCFLRRYDAKHLSAHPRQTVEAVWLSRSGTGAVGEGGTVLDFAFQARGRTYAATAYCKGSHCTLEGDGGAFALRRVGSDLQLSVGEHLALEGADGFSADLARSADDRVFRLHPAPRGACTR